jgi:hypothetical protein
MAVSVASYNKKYLRMKPEVDNIFNTLDDYLDFVRLQYPHIDYNPADIGRNESITWQRFVKFRNRMYYRNMQNQQRTAENNEQQ